MATQYNEDVLTLIDAELAPLNAARARLVQLRESIVEGIQGPYALSDAATASILASVRALVTGVTTDWKGNNAPPKRS